MGWWVDGHRDRGTRTVVIEASFWLADWLTGQPGDGAVGARRGAPVGADAGGRSGANPARAGWRPSGRGGRRGGRSGAPRRNDDGLAAANQAAASGQAKGALTRALPAGGGHDRG
jgi:hypothetical protein